MEMTRKEKLVSTCRSAGGPIASVLAVLAALATSVTLLGFVTGPGTSRASAAARTENHVVIKHFAFGRPMLTVPVGATVTWINDDEEPHTVTAKDGSFRSPALDQGDTFAYRFEQPGTYTYFCAIHPHMSATIIVR
jgi:plastocyanin